MARRDAFAALLLAAAMLPASSPADCAAAADGAVHKSQTLILKRKYQASAGVLAHAAETGDSDAQFRLAQMYRVGLGVPRDPERARLWLSRSARQGHAKAAALLRRWTPAKTESTGIVAPPWLPRSQAPRAEVNALAKDKGGNTWISRASGRNLSDQSSWLMAPADGTLLPAEAFKAPLLAAARAGSFDAARLLLRKTTPVAHGPQGETPLMLAAASGNTRLVSLLLAHGADASKTDKRGWTALHYAYAACRVTAASLLIGDRTAVANDTRGQPLLTVILKKCPDAGPVEELLSPLNVDSVDSGHRTALWIAASQGNSAWLTALLGHHADIRIADERGVTPLHAAAFNGHPGIVDELLRHGAATEAADESGNTPLMLAVAGGCLACAELLVKQTENIDAANSQGDTPLVAAVRVGNTNIAAVLLARGASRDWRNKRRETARNLAERLGEPAMLSLLGGD